MYLGFVHVFASSHNKGKREDLVCMKTNVYCQGKGYAKHNFSITKDCIFLLNLFSHYYTHVKSWVGK